VCWCHIRRPFPGGRARADHRRAFRLRVGRALVPMGGASARSAPAPPDPLVLDCTRYSPSPMSTWMKNSERTVLKGPIEVKERWPPIMVVVVDAKKNEKMRKHGEFSLLGIGTRGKLLASASFVEARRRPSRRSLSGGPRRASSPPAR
jgi:hypothetical protein